MWSFRLHHPIASPRYTLRHYQQRAIAEVLSNWNRGLNRNLICAPTGSGKGTMIGAIAHIAVEQGWKVVICLSMLSLVGQSIEDLLDFGLDGNISVISGSHPKEWTNYQKPIQIVMLQTIANQPDVLDYLAGANVVIMDEFHTSRNFEAAKVFLSGQTKTATFTATPYNFPFGEVADAAVLCPHYQQLESEGYLAPLRYSILKIQKEKGKKRDLNSDEGCRIAIAQFLQTDGVRAEGHKRSLWFCEAFRSGDEAHTKRLQRIALEDFGLRLVVVDDSMSLVDRDDAVAACNEGAIDGLVCVDALAVGVDIRSLRHLNLVRRVGSRDRYVQMVGRVTRPSPETGKTYGYVNDWGGNIISGHCSGLHLMIEVLSAEITQQSILRLPGEPVEGIAPEKECKKCGSMNHAAAIDCWLCGHPFPEKPKIGLNHGQMVTAWWATPSGGQWWNFHCT